MAKIDHNAILERIKVLASDEFEGRKPGTKGEELFKSDGTGAGTKRVKDINAGGGGSAPSFLTNVGGTLFFSANEHLSARYATGYAECSSALGPCTKFGRNPVLASRGVRLGPGAPAESPVVRVSWFAARAYAAWCGKRLPTTAEWERAAETGHSTARRSNELYRRNLAKGQTGLSVAFDLPTQTGYDADHELAREVIAADKEVNALQRDLEERAILIIARRQPMAQDLREIIAAIRIANELERIADLGKNIARRTLAIDSQPIARDLVVGVEHLANLGLRQLKRVLDSYGARDVELARHVWHADDEVDAVYVSFFRQVISYMIEDPRKVTLCTHLLFCAKNIERVGDHCTNIAETVHYLVTGEPLEEPADEALAEG